MSSINKGSNTRESHDGKGKSLYNSCATTVLDSIQCRLEQIRSLSRKAFLEKIIEFPMCLNIVRDLHKDQKTLEINL